MYGQVSAAWTLEGGRFELAVDVPANTRATVRLPGAQLGRVTEGGSPLGDGNGISGRRQDGDDAVVEVGSGRYRFAYQEAR
jgi:alpha-L-rhamnosidase